MPIEMTHPFTITGGGGVSATTNPDTQIHQHVRTLLGTNPGERRVVADYGVAAREMLFENDATMVGTVISERIRGQLETYEPGVLIERLDVLPSDSTQGSANIAINYTRREAPLSPAGIARNTNTAVISIGGTVSEVIRG